MHAADAQTHRTGPIHGTLRHDISVVSFCSWNTHLLYIEYIELFQSLQSNQLSIHGIYHIYIGYQHDRRDSKNQGRTSRG